MKFRELVSAINNQLTDDNYLFLYAFNATGKTRLSQALSDINDDEDGKITVICYNAFLEDAFAWDNENYEFVFTDNWVIKFIMDQGLDREVIENFKNAINKNIEPKFDFKNRKITFTILGDSNPIKISKGEETIFKWSLFYTVIDNAVEVLSEKEDERETSIFNDLKYIVIDDPVSSIDDYRIFNISSQIIKTLKSAREYYARGRINLPVLISTHHALFFNILFNAFRGEKHNFKYLLRSNGDDYYLDKQNDDSIISYHGIVIKELKEAIDNKRLQRHHFNLFRNVIEKTAAFVGVDNWSDLFEKYDKKDFESLKIALNSNSHTRFSDIDVKELSEEQVGIFEKGFEWFVKEYHFVFAR